MKPVAKKKHDAPAGGRSLHERLMERISSVVETAVAEMTRTAASGYLIKRLVVTGSFRNYEKDGEAQGFEIRLKNRIGVATVMGFTELKIDGENFKLDEVEISKGGMKCLASEVSDRLPLSVQFGDEILIRARKPGGISPGSHRIALGVDMVGIGGVDVDYEEKLSV
jgi:hypothetical protein